MLEQFVDYIIDMEWDEVTIRVRDGMPVIAHPLGDDFGMYVLVAPYYPIDDDGE